MNQLNPPTLEKNSGAGWGSVAWGAGLATLMARGSIPPCLQTTPYIDFYPCSHLLPVDLLPKWIVVNTLNRFIFLALFSSVLMSEMMAWCEFYVQRRLHSRVRALWPGLFSPTKIVALWGETEKIDLYMWREEEEAEQQTRGWLKHGSVGDKASCCEVRSSLPRAPLRKHDNKRHASLRSPRAYIKPPIRKQTDT